MPKKLSIKRRKDILDTFFPDYYGLETDNFSPEDWYNLIQDELDRDDPRRSVLKILHRKYTGTRRDAEWRKLEHYLIGWRNAAT